MLRDVHSLHRCAALLAPTSRSHTLRALTHLLRAHSSSLLTQACSPRTCRCSASRPSQPIARRPGRAGATVVQRPVGDGETVLVDSPHLRALGVQALRSLCLQACLSATRLSDPASALRKLVHLRPTPGLQMCCEHCSYFGGSQVEVASVLCSQLGLAGPGHYVDSSVFGPGSGPLLLSDEIGDCRPPYHIDNCERPAWSGASCGHEDDLGLLCSASLGEAQFGACALSKYAGLLGRRVHTLGV